MSCSSPPCGGRPYRTVGPRRRPREPDLQQRLRLPVDRGQHRNPDHRRVGKAAGVGRGRPHSLAAPVALSRHERPRSCEMSGILFDSLPFPPSRRSWTVAIRSPSRVHSHLRPVGRLQISRRFIARMIPRAQRHSAAYFRVFNSGMMAHSERMRLRIELASPPAPRVRNLSIIAAASSDG
jgi:hypothetical protein